MDANITSVVYGFIRDEDYSEALKILERHQQNFPASRVALSLLGHCYYHSHHYTHAADTYEKLVVLCPTVEEYKIYHCQSLLKIGLLHDASRCLSDLDEIENVSRFKTVQLNINMQSDQNSCKIRVAEYSEDDLDAIIADAMVEYKDGNYNKCIEKYSNVREFEPCIAYNIALCHYRLQNFDNAMVFTSKIIDDAIQKYPEFVSKTNKTEDCIFSYTSIINTKNLRDTFFVEACNLKFAIEFDKKNIKEATNILQEIPFRKEEEVDPVSLHNQAISQILSGSNDGFDKLNFLLSFPPFPQETFGNLLLLYCKNGYHDIAADILAENSSFTDSMLSESLHRYLDASVIISSSPEEALHKFESLTKTYMNSIRISETPLSKSSDDSSASKIKMSYHLKLDMLIPIIMAHASIFWGNENYVMVEKLLRQVPKLYQNSYSWELNMAHVLFMQQGDKFEESILYYRPLVERESPHNILHVSPIILANLCVAYIMTDRNQDAEKIMKRLENEEDKCCKNEMELIYHSCIVNIVLGTLYCEKGNFKFGIDRMCKSLEPLDSRKLCTDSWYYIKKCFLALADKVAKRMVFLDNSILQDMQCFLEDVDRHGRIVLSSLNEQNKHDEEESNNIRIISMEARHLRRLFLLFLEG